MPGVCVDSQGPVAATGQVKNLVPRMNDITDFFKPPPRETLTSPDKPKNLFGYFKKVDKEGAGGSSSASSRPGGLVGAPAANQSELAKESVAEKTASSAGVKSKKKKDGKEKEKGAASVDKNVLNDSLQEFDTLPLAQKKGKESKKKSGKSLSKQKKTCDTPDVVELPQSEGDNVKDDKESVTVISYEDLLKSPGIHLKNESDAPETASVETPSHKDEQCDVEKPKTKKRKRKLDMDSAVDIKHEKATSGKADEHNDSINLMEISYEDFLHQADTRPVNQKQTPKKKPAKSNSASASTPGSTGQSETYIEGSKTSEATKTGDSEKAASEKEKPKSLGIAKFFKKAAPTKSEKKDSDKVTFKADIHPPPSPPQNKDSVQSHSLSSKKKSNVIVLESDVDNSIEELGSVEITEPVKNTVAVNLLDSDSETEEVAEGPANKTDDVTNAEQKPMDQISEKTDQLLKKELGSEKSEKADKTLKKEAESEKQTSLSLGKREKLEESKKEATELRLKKVEENRKKMQSLDSLAAPAKFPVKATQATLSFGKKGMKFETIKPVHTTKSRTPSKKNDSTVLVESSDDESNKKNTSKKKTAVDAGVVEDSPAKLKKKASKRKPVVKTSTPVNAKAKPKASLVQKAKKVPKGKAVESDSISEEFQDESKKPQGRKRKKPVYRSTLMLASKMGGPPKLRLTRLNKTASSEENSDLQTPTRAHRTPKPQRRPTVSKVSKAKELIQKAKTTSKTVKGSKIAKGKRGKKSKESKKSSPTPIEESPGLRRSSRTTAMVAKFNITECVQAASTPKSKKVVEVDLDVDEVIVTGKTPSKKKRSESKKVVEIDTDVEEVIVTGKTPSKKKRSDPKQAGAEQVGMKTPKEKKTKTPKKTPKKGVKLAAIFSKKKAARDTSSPITISEDSNDGAPPKPMDPAKKAFLLSGVPDTLKKPERPCEVVVYGTSAPLPVVSHVLQRGVSEEGAPGLDVWNLSRPALPLREVVESEVQVAKKMEKGEITLCQDIAQVWTMDKGFSAHADLSSDVAKVLLMEIVQDNPMFPVKRLYKYFLSRKQEIEKGPDAIKPLEEKKTESKPIEIGKKRKQDETEDDATSTAPPSKRSKRRLISDDSDVVVVSEDVKKEDTPAEEESGRPVRRSSRTRTPAGGDVPRERRSLSLRSSRRRQSFSPQVEIVGDKKEEEKDEPGSVQGKEPPLLKLQWTEKYQPSHSSQLISNTGHVKKLRNWLGEWKQRTDREVRKMKKQLRKEAQKEQEKKGEGKKEGSPGWWSDDDSDFDMSSEEDSDYAEEEEDGMCNTMLITGPVGIGKTATVYALAQELGYKIFEVNASQKRNGKQILAQLQEATQSHQVCKKNLDTMFTTFMQTSAASKDTPKAKADKKLPTAFANFFNKGNKPGKKEEGKGKKKEEKPKKEKESKKSTKGKPLAAFANLQEKLAGGADMAKIKKGLELSSTSLILFEEVDIVFEEDKGFWAAIQTFMSSTKRPIIMTTNDAHFTERFEGTFEQLMFKRPSASNICSLLQVMSLAEGVRTDFSDLLPLVSLRDGDLRQSILQLQLWAKSGGGLDKRDASAKLRPRSELLGTPRKHMDMFGNNSLSQLSQDSSQGKPYNSEDDFSLTPQIKRRRRGLPIIEDDSSCGSNPGTPAKISQRAVVLPVLLEESQDAQMCPLGGTEDSQDSTSAAVGAATTAELMEYKGPLPQKHLLCFESSTGISNLLDKQQSALSLLQCCGCRSRVALTSFAKSLRIEVTYSNLLHSLPLPKVPYVAIRPPPPTISIKPRRSRIKNNDDMYDSEASSDGFATLNSKKVVVGESESEGNADTETEAQTDIGDVTKTSAKRKASKEDAIVYRSLEALSEMYDNISLLDSYQSIPSLRREGASRKSDFDWSKGRLCPGLSVAVSRYEEENWWKYNHHAEMVSAVEVASVESCVNRLQGCLTDVQSLRKEVQAETRSQLSLPVHNCNPQLQLSQESMLDRSLQSSRVKAAENAGSTLPVHMQCQRRSIATDYLPILRTICKSEQFRQAAKTKRRFFHYLDSISLPLKQSVIDTFCSSFP